MKIKVPFKKLQYIAHISDVHVRLFRRHDEYQQVFSKLYEQLEQLKHAEITDYVIVLAGDIVHAKTDMSPEMLQLTSNFLSIIADFAPTILIAGNHDCNLANSNRMDALTPIVKSLNHPNLHYIKNSAVVHVADTAFAVCSIFDPQEHWPTADEIDPGVTTKIALHHGPVHGAITDANFVITNRHVNINTFDGYDLVLLGDIHRGQVLQEYDANDKKPLIRYSSSLIQQSHGETLDGHGWCLWDVPNRSVEFVSVENEFGYVTIEAIGDVIHLPTTMPKNIRLRFFTGELDNVAVKKIVTKLRKNHNIVELSVAKSRNNNQLNKSVTLSTDNLDLQNPSVQNTLLIDWLTRNYPILSNTTHTAIEKINVELNSKLVHEDHSRNISWRPLNFSFSNMFSYGENNSIDFSDMNGLYGIFAANASGKSSVMDALMFCLYDKTPRAFKGDHIINNRKDLFECELLFDINNETFGIKRIGTRKKNGDVKVDVSFWKILDTGEILNLNGEDRRDTNAKIRSHVGSYEDFVMTALSSQNSNSLFIDKSHSERKDLLIQFMGLSVFDKLYDLANNESKEIAGILKRFKKSDVTDQISQTHAVLTDVQQRYHDAQVFHKQLSDTQKTLDSKLSELQNQKKPLNRDFADISLLNKKVHDLNEVIKKATENYQYTIVKYETLKEEHANISTEFDTFDMAKLKVSVQKYMELCEIERNASSELNLLNIKIEEKTKFRDKLSKYQYNPKCDVCVRNNISVVNDLQTAIFDLENLYTISLKKQQIITDTNRKIKELESDKFAYDEGLQLQTQIQSTIQNQQRLKVELDFAKETITNRTEQRNRVLSEIELYELNQTSIIFNKDIDVKIQTVQEDIAQNKKLLTKTDADLRDLHGKLAVLQAKKDELQAKLKEAEELETTYEAYTHYMLATSRDGVPYEIMTKVIPVIESEVNTILSQIVNFTVSLEVDGKNIDGKLMYDADRIWPLENCSGMERFISSLAIRIALMNSSNLPKPNFLIVDEGFGVLDADNLHAMQTLFQIMKNYFDFILIVSHLDVMRDMVDNIIEIKKDGGYSSIVV